MPRMVGMLLIVILLALALSLAQAEVIKRPNPDGSVSLIVVAPTSSTPDVIAATKQAMQAAPASRIISERHKDEQTSATVPVGSVTGCGVGELPHSRTDALRAYRTLQAALQHDPTNAECRLLLARLGRVIGQPEPEAAIAHDPPVRGARRYEAPVSPPVPVSQAPAPLVRAPVQRVQVHRDPVHKVSERQVPAKRAPVPQR